MLIGILHLLINKVVREKHHRSKQFIHFFGHSNTRETHSRVHSQRKRQRAGLSKCAVCFVGSTYKKRPVVNHAPHAHHQIK